MDLTRLKELFSEALEQSPELRAAFLDQVCAHDGKLRARIEQMLRVYDGASGFMGDPTAEYIELQKAHETAAVPTVRGKIRAISHPPSEQVGAHVGPYKLLEQIGEGGFGVVYLAQQERPVRRRVALKVIKLGMDTNQVVARFEAERQALAMMNHPHIARVLDAGATEAGRPYFVMELVRGESITKFCDEHRLSVGQRLELFTDVCNAVQHAHTKGVIHRDIKPSNVLVAMQDDHAVAKVIDFGIAKATSGRLTEKTVYTEFRAMIGTPEYMSPEQARMSSLDVDTRTDVYSLGVLLYELLTGMTPFDSNSLLASGFAEMQRIIREVEPPRPSTRVSNLGGRSDPAAQGDESGTRPAPSVPSVLDVAKRRCTDPKSLSRAIRGDLDWIVMKCLEKDRSRRYETASGLAMDIGRYLAAEPVIAAPPSAAYRARRFMRRNKGMVGASAAVLAMLLIAVGGTTYGMFRAFQARREALHQADIASAVTNFLNDDFFGSLKDLANDPSMNFEGLRSVLELAGKRLDDASVPGGRFANEPLIQLRLRTTIAEALLNIGAFDRSSLQFERAYPLAVAQYGRDGDETITIEMRRASALLSAGRPDDARPIVLELVDQSSRLYGAQDSRTLDALGNLARLHELHGDVAVQRSVQRRLVDGWSAVFEQRRRELGPLDPQTLNALDELSRKMSWLGRFVEAEPRARELVEKRREVLGMDDPATIRAIDSLRQILRWLTQYEESLSLAEQVLDARRKINGSEHPLTIAALRATAWQLGRLGRFEEAESRFSEAIDLYKRVFGEDHPEYLGCLGDSVMLYCLSDQLKRAEARQRDVLATCQRVLGDEHPWTLDARNGLGIVFQRQGRYEDADENLSTVLAMRRRLLGEEDPATLSTYSSLGTLRQQQNRFGEAAELHARTLEARRRVLGEDHLDTVTSMFNLAIQYSMLGRYDDAERLLLVVLERRVPALGNAHFDTMDARQVLGYTVSRGGRIDEGREILERANAIAQGAEREDTREGLLTMAALAEAYQRSRRFDEAEDLYRRAIAAAPHVLSAEHPILLYPMCGLGSLYNEQKRFAEAEEVLTRSLEIRRRVVGETHPETIQSMENLAVSLRGLGKVDELRSLLAELIAARQAIAEKDYASADDLNECAWLLLTAEPADLRDPAAALPVAEKAAEMSARTNANVLDTLAHAQRMAGAYDQAARTYGEAATLVYSGDFASNSRDEHSVLEGMVTLIGSARDAGDVAAAHAACLVAEDAGRKLLLKRTTGDHEWSDAARNFLGMVLLQCGELTEAESLIRESLEHRMKLLPEDHWLIGNSMSLLGEALFGQGRFEDAEALLVEGYEKLRKDATALEDRKYDALERIVRFYKEWNAADPGQGHAEKVAEYRAMLSAYPVRPPCYCERPMAAASTVPNGRFRSPYSHLGEFSKAEPLLVQTNELAMRVYPNGDSRLVAQAERWRQQARSENSDERARSGPSP